MTDFYLQTFSCLALLSLSMGIYLLAKKTRIPFTVLLVAFGLVLGWIISHEPRFSFLLSFELGPEMLFYVFLPILLFESGYNMRIKDLMANKWSIGLLAIVSLIISALITSAIMYVVLTYIFDIQIPFIIYFLFGALISATDPVAVLALFKECNAPKRLTLIFEGESLFNDGTALAFFLVILGVVMEMSGYQGSHGANLLDHLFASHHGGIWIALKGILSFLSMLLLGGLFGAIIGLLASKFVKKIKWAPLVEITISILLAHVTFLLAEGISHFVVPLSWVIATTIAAVVFGSIGRKHLSPEIESTMHSIWDYMAFVTNAIIFLLLGIMIIKLWVHWNYLIIPVAMSIVAVMVARALSVYSVITPFNALKMEEEIPKSWQHLLSWWSLRGALAIIMALLIPADLSFPGWQFPLSVQEFILGLTVGCVVFTLFIKALTITPLMKKLHIK